VLLVDLRCHGESTQLAQRPARPHSVESAAEDVLKLLGQLKLFPEVLVGHSFGGKVVMSMVEQFGRIGSRLPRPLQARRRTGSGALPCWQSERVRLAGPRSCLAVHANCGRAAAECILNAAYAPVRLWCGHSGRRGLVGLLSHASVLDALPGCQHP